MMKAAMINDFNESEPLDFPDIIKKGIPLASTTWIQEGVPGDDGYKSYIRWASGNETSVVGRCTDEIFEMMKRGEK